MHHYFPSGTRQVWWAHLAGNFERFAHSKHSSVKMLGAYLRQIAVELFALKRSLLNRSIGLLTFLRRIRKLRQLTWYGLKFMANLSDAVHTSRAARKIMEVEPMLWKFAENPLTIPLTNNLVQRQLRHYVVYRKNSYFTQSERGNRFLERIISLYLPWKLQNLKPYLQLQNLLH